MRNVKILAAAGLLTMAGIAHADVTGTAAIVSDYDFRGITQSDEDPAVQLSIDYASDSGWYVGVWGSSIEWLQPESSAEVDLYTGFKGNINEDLGWDVGLVYYAFPDSSDVNTIEIYGKLTYNVITGAVYFTDDYYDTDENAYYVSVDAGIPAGPLTIGLHAGLSSGDGIGFGIFGNPDFEDSYTDYGLGVSYSANNFTLGMKWVAADFGDGGSDDRVVLSISTAFPWMQ